MNIQQLLPTRRIEFLASIIVYQLVVLVMMGCLALAVMQLGQRILPGWNNSYQVPVLLMVSIEAMLTARMVRPYAILTREWLAHRTAEWVVIIISLKAALYLVYGPAQVLKDVLVWDEDFFGSFFTAEYMVLILLALLFWTLSSAFTNYLLELEESVEELDLESQGIAVKDRQLIRHGLVGLVFGTGLLLLVVIAFVHIDLNTIPTSQVSLRTNILMLLVYFLMGFILLAQSQYFILRAQWYLQKIPASPEIASRWAIYSLVLLLVIAGLVLLLPTGYSASLFDTLQVAIMVVIGAVSYLVMLLLTPFLWLIQYLTHLFAGNQTEQSPPLTPPPVLQPRETWEPDIIIQVLKSLLFWSIFFSVILFSFRFYFSQRRDLIENLKKKPGLRWLANLLEWLDALFRRINRRIETGLTREAARLRSAAARRQLRLPSLAGALRRLPARHQVILTYLTMLHWNEKNGIYRRKAQTPFEYASMLEEIVPDATVEIDGITRLFMEARYTRHEIDQADAETAQHAWSRLKQFLLETER